MKQTIFLKGLGAGLAGLLGGCADMLHIADYQRPDAPAKSAWSKPAATNTAATVSAAATISPQWWSEFRDPMLDSLVNRAVAGNFDLKILAARIEVASAQVAEVRAGALPTADLGAGASFERSTGQKFSKQFSLGTQVSWDIDVWGRVSKGVAAQTAGFHATEADWRAAYLQLVAAVSTTYFQILQLDEQLERQQRGANGSDHGVSSRDRGRTGRASEGASGGPPCRWPR